MDSDICFDSLSDLQLHILALILSLYESGIPLNEACDLVNTGFNNFLDELNSMVSSHQ